MKWILLTTILLVLTIGILSFTDRNEEFKREKHLTSYLMDVELLELEDRGSYKLFYLVQVGYCGNCNRSVIKFVRENAPRILAPRVILTNNGDNAKVIEDKLSPVECHLGDSEIVDKHGLISTANYVFLYQGAELIWWKEFNSENRNEISSHITKYAEKGIEQYSLKSQ